MSPSNRRRLLGALAVAAPLAIAACSNEPDEYIERPPEDLYNDGFQAMMDERYPVAAKSFEEVERQHPYSVWATQAQLMAAYAYYEDNKYDDAIGALDNFIRDHPGNPKVAYAYYLKALCYYEQIADVARDQKMTEDALQALTEVINRFPNSDYARDARLKIDLTRDHLAGKEMNIGRYYLDRGQYLAAINRFRRVIELFQTTTHVPEALHRLTECYLALGITDEAQTAAAVLGYNYPGSDWYQDSYGLLAEVNLQPEEKEGSWLQDAF